MGNRQNSSRVQEMSTIPPSMPPALRHPHGSKDTPDQGHEWHKFSLHSNHRLLLRTAWDPGHSKSRDEPEVAEYLECEAPEAGVGYHSVTAVPWYSEWQ